MTPIVREEELVGPVGDACAVSIEVDGRQRYLFETDKLQEMLGASRLMDGLRDEALRTFGDERERILEGATTHIFNLVSGEIRAWALMDHQKELLDRTWGLRRWMHEQGIEHSVAYLECSRMHFEEARSSLQEDHGGSRAPADEEPPSDKEPEHPDLSWVHQQLGRLVRKRKDAKSGQDAQPTCSLFASCRIHGVDAANCWKPGPSEAGGGEEPRRQLVGRRAMAKYRHWDRGSSFYNSNLFTVALESAARAALAAASLSRDSTDKLNAVISRAVTFSHLASPEREAQRGDSYIAFVCADGDAMGAFLSRLDWNAPTGWTEPLPWKRNLDFTEEYDRCVKVSFEAGLIKAAIPKEARDWDRRVRITGQGAELYVPLLPQILGGDDLWMVCDREVVLDFAHEFASKYAELVVGEGTTLASALCVAKARGLPADERLSISLGVAFAKAGFPAYAMADAAEGLLKSAKALRKGAVWNRPTGRERVGKEACLDWYWIASSLSEGIADARAKGWAYTDECGNVMLLTSRPWTVAQSAQFKTAAEILHNLPRRKREQLESILRRGYRLSMLGWEAWWKGLEDVSLTGHAADRKDGRAFFTDNVNAQLPDGWNLLSPDEGALCPWIRLGVIKDKGPDGSGKETERAVYATPLLDLMELQHVLGLEGTSDDTTVAEEEPASA